MITTESDRIESTRHKAICLPKELQTTSRGKKVVKTGWRAAPRNVFPILLEWDINSMGIKIKYTEQKRKRTKFESKCLSESLVLHFMGKRTFATQLLAFWSPTMAAQSKAQISTGEIFIKSSCTYKLHFGDDIINIHRVPVPFQSPVRQPPTTRQAKNLTIVYLLGFILRLLVAWHMVLWDNFKLTDLH